jgi:non-heme chloroperoxidase
MSMITTKDGTQLYYKDWGRDSPAVFSHGWPLTADAFEDQMFFLASNGYRMECVNRTRIWSRWISLSSSNRLGKAQGK